MRVWVGRMETKITTENLLSISFFFFWNPRRRVVRARQKREMRGGGSWRGGRPAGASSTAYPLLGFPPDQQCIAPDLSVENSLVTMAVDRKAAVYLGAHTLRLLLLILFPSLPDLLTGRVEVSTPVTSFKRRKS